MSQFTLGEAPFPPDSVVGDVPKRFLALRTIASILKILTRIIFGIGVIFIIICIISVLFATASSRTYGIGEAAIAVFIVTSSGAIGCAALGESILLFIEIEHNQRMQIALQNQLYSRLLNR